MKLRRIGLEMNSRACDDIYYANFQFHTYFIWHYMSMQVRKLKFETDGTFSGIIVEVGVESPSSEIHFFNDYLIVGVPFDFDFYDNANQAQKYQYYLELLQEGLQIASRHKNIPLEEINNFIPQLVENNFIYSWDFKKIRVPEYNLKLKFTCHLSTYDFILKLTAFRNKELEPICEGIVARTLPDYIFFSDISRDIQIKNDRIYLYFKSGSEVLSIGLKNILEGNLIIDYSESPYPDNPSATETFRYLQNSLRYDSYDFT